MKELEVLEREVSRLTTDSVQRVHALHELAEALLIWDSARALKLSSDALRISERLLYPDGIAKSLSLAALGHMYQGDHQRALDEAQTALSLFENADDVLNQAMAHATIGTVHSQIGSFEPAFEHLYRAIELESETTSRISTVRSYLSLGNIYHKLADYTQALHFLNSCLDLSIEHHFERAEPLALSTIGAVYFDLGEYSTSIAYYQRSLNIYQHCSDGLGEAYTLERMGLICSRMGGLEDALVFHRRSMVLRRENKDKRGLATSLYHIGEILSLQNFDAQALLMYKESLDLRKQTQDRIGMAESYLGFASVHIKENSPVHNNIVANDLLIKCLSIASSLRIKKLEMKAHELLAISFKQIKLFEKAVQHMEMCLDLREQIAGDDVGQQVKQLEIQLIKEKSEREAERNRLENVELAGALKKVEALNQHLAHLNQEKNDLLSIVFHDLKNPIAGILVNTSTLERYIEKMSPEDVLKTVRAIASTTTRMKDIIAHLLEMNKIDSGNYSLQLEAVHLGRIVDQAVRDSSFRARSKSLRVFVEHDSEDVYVLAEAKALRECVENYLSNALKYSPVGKQIIVRVGDSTVKNFKRFSISDEGVGISPEDQKKLFSRYSKVGTKTTGGEESNGLGLSSVKKFIELMNGTVGCESEVGLGSTFYFDLPMAALPESHEAELEAQSGLQTRTPSLRDEAPYGNDESIVNDHAMRR